MARLQTRRRTMSVLVACEESQAVCVAFRELGYEAYSCDLEPCSGGHPEWHIQADALELLKLRWDIVIAFPPCTYLTNAGNRWLYHAGGAKSGQIQQRNEGKGLFLEVPSSRLPSYSRRESETRTCFRYAAGVSGNPAVYVRPSVYKGNSPMASRASAAHGNRYSRSRIYMVSIKQERQQWVCCSQWQSSVKNFSGNCAGNGRTMGAIHI